jgi:alkylation response protein AidB-like acyl-CoA dehydrogenase
MSTATVQRASLSAEETQALRDAVREVCTRHAGAEPASRRLDEAPDTPPDAALWRALTTELGIGGLLVPEQFGGAGVSWATVRVVLEELGRALACAPFIPSVVMAVELLLAIGDAQACADLLPGIADGSVVATVAVVERQTSWDDWAVTAGPSNPITVARSGSDGWQLSGTKRVVAFGASADLLLVAASTHDGTAVFAVEKHSAGIDVASLPTLDATRPVADITFTDTPARLIGTTGGAGDLLQRVLDCGALAVAAEDAGAARFCLQQSVDYALLRTQFGRQIGSFQAVKHKLADMLVRVELAEAAVEEAALVADQQTPEAAVAACVAHACAADSFRLVAAETIQTHGGMGFTWEHSAHLYFRRAKTSALTFGGPAQYRARLLDRLQLDAPIPAGRP